MGASQSSKNLKNQKLISPEELEDLQVLPSQESASINLSSLNQCDNITADNQMTSTNTDNSPSSSMSSSMCFHKGIVTVHRPSGPLENQDIKEVIYNDPIIQRLREIQNVLPIIEEKKPHFWGRAKRETNIENIRSIDPEPLLRMTSAYHDKLFRETCEIVSEQNSIIKRVQAIDSDVDRLFKGLSVQQKRFAKNAMEFNRIPDLNYSINRCQSLITELENSVNLLNGMLSFSDRLEPFQLEDD